MKLKSMKTFLLSLVLGVFLATSLSAEMHILPISKTEQWQQMANEVDSWGDGLGYPIDEGIKELVIVLNLLGFKTAQSCEGHLDHGHPFPWVYFLYEGKEHEDLVNRYLPNEDTVLSAEERQALENEFLALSPIRDIQLKPLNDLLEEFYKDRPESTFKYFVWEGANLYLLYPIDFEVQIARDEQEKALKMEDYRAELNAFTEFLKAKFFNN